MHDPKVIVALDYADMNQALAFADKIEPGSCRLKVGKEMFTLFGPALVKQLHAGGHDVFLDLKFHDIPNTCARAVAAAAELGVWMVNVHASGGERMMVAAREALAPYGGNRPWLIGVTVLTSMTKADLADSGLVTSPQAQVQRLAGLTQQAGLDGVVCSAHEASMLKAQCGDTFKLVTPGIRPAGSAAGDQRRIMTPEAAVNAGSDYLVIGRPVTQAADPAAVLHTINQSLRP